MGQIEQESLKNLIKEKESVDHKLASASDVYAHLETPGWINQRNPKALKLRLDVDPLNKFRNLDRVGNIKQQLQDIAFPTYWAGIKQLITHIDSHRVTAGEEIEQPLPYEQPPVKPRVPDIERRDPKIRHRVGMILDQLDKYQIKKSINNPQMTKFFPVLKVTFVENQIEKRVIEPERGNDHHPVFKPEEIATLLYVYGNGDGLGGMTSRMVKQLTAIISAEMQRRNQSKSNHINGNPC